MCVCGVCSVCVCGVCVCGVCVCVCVCGPITEVLKASRLFSYFPLLFKGFREVVIKVTSVLRRPDTEYSEQKRYVIIVKLICLLFWQISALDLESINLIKPTGHVMHHQFNIQQLYALPTLYLCVLYLSENKQRLVPLTA